VRGRMLIRGRDSDVYEVEDAIQFAMIDIPAFRNEKRR
jgi:hypothetical protein